MKQVLVRYQTKPDRAAENARLIKAVFEELEATRPNGVRYTVLRLEDNTFVHIVSIEDGAERLQALPAFQAFQAGISERCLVEPQVRDATIVGQYGAGLTGPDRLLGDQIRDAELDPGVDP